MRLIDADAQKTIKSIQSADFNSIETIREWIDAQPTIDAEPVRRGEWHKGGYVCGDTEWICSSCGHGEWRAGVTNYCPNCGAKMNGEE